MNLCIEHVRPPNSFQNPKMLRLVILSSLNVIARLSISIVNTNDKVYYNTRGEEAQYGYCA
ncbi:hypothetical protein DPMN_130036 [Dreissena polymorpha]|uniref:Uncharacterized protein n=1 Tax=Dreissena polymorpha TaxID=45954 RepID=A0A9D4H6W0_DREPO|nr:hypothetical protein DPMN_130036 [Dreissena polymorpha]